MRQVIDVSSEPTVGWNELTVEPLGGHLYQGREWAEHRAAAGWRAHFLHFDDGRRALVLTKPRPPLPGLVGLVSRGPVASGDSGAVIAERVAAIGEWAKTTDIRQLIVDPELDDDEDYRASLAAYGWQQTEELEPSRHRMIRHFEQGTDEAALWAGLSKSTRQRIRAAEKSGVSVSEDESGHQMTQFASLVWAMAEIKHFTLTSQQSSLAWWRRAHGAGQMRLWLARQSGAVVGGILVHVQGGHFSTAYSADIPARRDELPGIMHLLRWTVLREAHTAGHELIDLGGVDLAGHRREPEPGDPLWGLYQHKRSFGAQFVYSAGAHRLVVRPGQQALADLFSGGLDIVRRLRRR